MNIASKRIMKTNTIARLVSGLGAVALLALATGCSVFTGANTAITYEKTTSTGDMVKATYKSPKEQKGTLRINPETGEVVAEINATHNADLAAGAATVMSEANKAIAEAAGRLVDKIPTP